MNKQKQPRLMKVISLVKMRGSWAVQVKTGFIWPRIKYIDLQSPEFKWKTTDKHFDDCLGTEDRAWEVYNALVQKDVRPVVEVIATTIKK